LVSDYNHIRYGPENRSPLSRWKRCPSLDVTLPTQLDVPVTSLPCQEAVRVTLLTGTPNDTLYIYSVSPHWSINLAVRSTRYCLQQYFVEVRLQVDLPLRAGLPGKIPDQARVPGKDQAKNSDGGRRECKGCPVGNCAVGSFFHFLFPLVTRSPYYQTHGPQNHQSCENLPLRGALCLNALLAGLS